MPIQRPAPVSGRKEICGSLPGQPQPSLSPRLFSIACVRRRWWCKRCLQPRWKSRWPWSAEPGPAILSKSNRRMQARSSGCFATTATRLLRMSRWLSSAPRSNRRRTTPTWHARPLPAQRRDARSWHSIARRPSLPMDSSPGPRSTKRAPPCSRPKPPSLRRLRRAVPPPQEPASSPSAHRWQASCWCARSTTARWCRRTPCFSSWAHCRVWRSMRMSMKPMRTPCAPGCPRAHRCPDRNPGSRRM